MLSVDTKLLKEVSQDERMALYYDLTNTGPPF
jgi:hypothetical protein